MSVYLNITEFQCFYCLCIRISAFDTFTATTDTNYRFEKKVLFDYMNLR